MPERKILTNGNIPNRIRHTINVRCKFRYELYKTELTTAFNTIINLSRQNANARLASALQDKRLFQELADLLDAFVVPGVEADLERTGPGRPGRPGRLTANLYQNDHLFERLKVRKNLADNPTQQQIFSGNNYQPPNDRLRTILSKWPTQRAYLNYAKTYIKQDVNGFFTRNPLCRNAVRKIASNFTNNLRTFVTNLLADWNDVNTCFFGGNAQRLQTIRTTGSDYHKGGKQVLILTFQVNGNGPNKLVYKPSDIEIDCRLVGDIAGVQNQLPHGLQITNSFAELINGFLNDDCPLQTYKILPRNPGSLLQADVYGTVSIRNSYGYIEYLNHIPERPDDNAASDDKTLTQAGNVPTNQIANSDWITTVSDDARKFWQIIGKLWAMLTVCGCSDIHVQNFRVHRKKPQVIDLEESFKQRNKTYADSYLSNYTLRRPGDPGSKEPEVVNNKTLTIALEFNLKGGGFALNKLVVRQPNQQAVIAKQQDYLQPAAQGFIDTIYALRDQANNQQIRNWLTAAQNMIVRHVPISTSQLATEMRYIFSKDCVQAQQPQNNADYTQFPSNANRRFITKFTSTEGSGYITRFNAPIVNQNSNADTPELAWKMLPKFAIFHPDHNFHDYFNLDVPSYYHRLGDAHLLNSRGQRVNPSTTWTWWRQNVFTVNGLPNETPLTPITGRPGTNPPRFQPADTFTTFFPASPYSLFQGIFTELRTWSDNNLQSFIIENLKQLKQNSNISAGITIAVDNVGNYIIPTGNNDPSFQARRDSVAMSLSYASEFQTSSDEQSVLLNGMKVLFDRSAPVYPVNLVHKDKLPPKRHPKKVKPQRY